VIFILKDNICKKIYIMENKENKKEVSNLDKALEGFLNTENQDPNLDCSSGVCVIKGDKSLVERINKKIITEDGRQLLF
jgi:hypothetical protein